MLTAFWNFIAGVATFFMMIYGMIIGVNDGSDTVAAYKNTIDGISAFTNTIETALPQTDIYDIIQGHFDAPLAQGKTEKKCIVLGYDGCRADALALIDGSYDSAIDYLNKSGGETSLVYCGGVNYPEINRQDTSTAPGWCSILTGEWASVTGITGNGIAKSTEYKPLFISLVEGENADSAAFYVSWDGHFVDDTSTYRLDRTYIEENNLNVKLLDAQGDTVTAQGANGTYENTLADVQSADCSDFIFTIFEHTDHAGHGTGFGSHNPDYVSEFKAEEELSCDIIKAIEARETYATEDWMIIITADHGGYNTGHGSLTIQERMIFVTVR